MCHLGKCVLEICAIYTEAAFGLLNPHSYF